MKLITKRQMDRLAANGRVNAARMEGDGDTVDFKPVVKLFCPWGTASWLLTKIDPEEPDIAFGLCDLGMGCPEIGSVRLSELQAIRGIGRLRIERDRFFTASKTLSAYANEARAAGCIRA